MDVKATCPRNPAHKLFVTVAHVTQDWIVDEQGEFQRLTEDAAGETTHGPDPDNTWTCNACGIEAKVERITYDDVGEIPFAGLRRIPGVDSPDYLLCLALSLEGTDYTVATVVSRLEDELNVRWPQLEDRGWPDDAKVHRQWIYEALGHRGKEAVIEPYYGDSYFLYFACGTGSADG